MRFLKPALQLLLVAVLGVLIWKFLFPPPEKVIAKKIKGLAQTVSENPQGNISRIANVNRIGAFFHPNVSINLEGFGREVSSIQGKGELEQMAMGLRQNNFHITVRFSNVHVTVGDEKTNAAVLMTAEVKLNDQTEPMVQDIRLEYEKFDRAWLIRSAQPAKRLKIQ